MTRKSYDALNRELSDMRVLVSALSTDPRYGITTSSAIPFELPRVASAARFVVFIDLDNMHAANEKHGYSVVDGKIKRAVHVRHTDCLLRARWFSGDEIVFVLAGDPQGFCDRLAACLKNEGLSATMAYTRFTGDIDRDVKKVADLVQQAKRENRRASITAATFSPAMA